MPVVEVYEISHNCEILWSRRPTRHARTPLTIGDSTALDIGERLIIVGYPLSTGPAGSVTRSPLRLVERSVVALNCSQDFLSGLEAGGFTQAPPRTLRLVADHERVCGVVR